MTAGKFTVETRDQRDTSLAFGARTRPSVCSAPAQAGSATPELIRPPRARGRPPRPQDAVLDHRLAYSGGTSGRSTIDAACYRYRERVIVSKRGKRSR